jgi:hypothetical protein
MSVGIEDRAPVSDASAVVGSDGVALTYHQLRRLFVESGYFSEREAQKMDRAHAGLYDR